MVSNLSILATSSSLNTTQPEKRKMSAAWSKHTKRQRHSQHSNDAALFNSIPAPFTAPLHAAPSNAAAMAFPMVGVNGATHRWTTAVALEASSRATALPPPRIMAAANTPGMLGLQLLGVGSAPQMAGVNSAAPLVLAHIAGQLVPLPVHSYGYEPAAGGFASMAGTADGGLPIAATLDSFRSTILTHKLTALMPVCYPPLWQYQSRTGAPLQWWPMGSEPWWASEVAAAHLPGMATGPLPFVSGRLLKKADKVAVLVAIVKHLSPDFTRITAATSKCTLSTLEATLWNAALESERAKCMGPVFVVQLQAVAAAYGRRQAGTFPYDFSITHPAAANPSQAVAVVEYGGVVAPAYGSLQNVANFVGDSGAHIGTMVTKPIESMPQQGQGGHVDATFFSSSDPGGQQLEDILKPFLPKQADRFGEGIRSSNAALVANEEGDGHPWYKNEEPRRRFPNMPFGSPHSYFKKIGSGATQQSCEWQQDKFCGEGVTVQVFCWGSGVTGRGTIHLK